MTIKRRIFLSNILMIVLTMAIGGIVFLGVRFFTVDEYTQTRGGSGGRFVDFAHIPIAPTSRADVAFERGNFTYTASVSMYISDLGDFVILIPDNYYVDFEDFLRTPNFIIPTVALYLVIVLLLGNVLIAKYITKRIMTPINTLAKGAQEIAEGNLTHRIKYSGGDEFDVVCSDFNFMATRLFEMVEQRQADEKSRKELIAGISHDLKTPLTSIKAYTQGLGSGIAKTPEMQEKYLTIIQNKTEDIEYIIKQLFMFSQIDIGEFPLNIEVVNIGEEIELLVNSFTEEYKKMGLEITLVENVKTEYVSIDRVQFKNIMQNILGNCVKYCNVENPHGKIICKKIDSNISISITDNGVGVKEEMVTKMFDIFYRGDEARNNPGKGSGLGLAICSKIISRLNGTIYAKNIKGEGLEITLTLPINKKTCKARLPYQP